MNFKNGQERVVYGKSQRVYDTQKHILQLQKRHSVMAFSTPVLQAAYMPICEYSSIAKFEI